MQTYKIVFFGDKVHLVLFHFGDATSAKLRVDTTATIREKHDPSKHGYMSILIYKSYMYTKVFLDPERCSFKVDLKARNHWVSTHARHIGQLEDVSSPLHILRDEAMEEETMG